MRPGEGCRQWERCSRGFRRSSTRRSSSPSTARPRPGAAYSRRSCSGTSAGRSREPDDKETIEPRHVYIAPADYHLLVDDGHFALSVDARVQFARPSIDVLFESVAESYRDRAIGIVLTGANEDGAAGLASIKRSGGVSIVQDPRTAERRMMPDAALAAVEADAVLQLEEMGHFLYGLCSP